MLHIFNAVLFLLSSALSQEEQDDTQLRIEDIIQMVSITCLTEGIHFPARFIILSMIAEILYLMNDTEKLPPPTLHCGKNDVLVMKTSFPYEDQLWSVCIVVHSWCPNVWSYFVFVWSSVALCSSLLFCTYAVCLSVNVFLRRRVLKRSVLSLSQQWNWQNRSPCWITLCSGVFLMSEYIIQDIGGLRLVEAKL